jgi:hypothetical protein
MKAPALFQDVGNPLSNDKVSHLWSPVLSTCVEVLWRILKRIFRFERDEVTVRWKKLHSAKVRSFYLSLDIVKVIKPHEDVICRARSTHGGCVECVQSCSRSAWMKGRTAVGSIVTRDLSERNLKRGCGLDRVQWRILCTQQWTFRLNKRRGISYVDERLSASQQGLCSVELETKYRSSESRWFRIFSLYWFNGIPCLLQHVCCVQLNPRGAVTSHVLVFVHNVMWRRQQGSVLCLPADIRTKWSNLSPWRLSLLLISVIIQSSSNSVAAKPEE